MKRTPALLMATGLVLMTGSSPAFATNPDAGVVATSTVAPGSMASKDVDTFQQTAVDIRALMNGTLPTSKKPRLLFDIDIEDAPAVEAEHRRLDLMVAAAASHVVENSTRSVDRIFVARLQLDEARREFYGLPKATRDELVADQRAKTPSLDTPQEAMKRASDDAQRADAAKAAALEAASHARTEGAKLVHQEVARLMGVAKQQAGMRSTLASSRAAVEKNNDEVLQWKRRAHDAMQSASAADATYVELRKALGGLRTDLATAMAASRNAHPIPGAGPDPLTDLPPDVDRTEATTRRREVEREMQSLTTAFVTFDADRADRLMAQVEMLNGLRLELLNHLSSARMSEVTGLTALGWDQARAELRQVVLVIQYHLLAATRWTSAAKRSDTKAGLAAWSAASLVLRWAFVLVMFILWRRQAHRLLTNTRDKMRADERKVRRRNATMSDSPRVRMLGFFIHIRGPLEWLVLVRTLLWLMPDGIRGLLEVQLLATVATWTLSASVIVSVIDGFASEDVRGPRRIGGADNDNELRLRSLRLVARTVVVFGVILSISSQLVGEGTIYRWVFTFCWFSAIPVLLVIVGWWKPRIFKRVERARKKRAFERWILDRNEGAMSFPAAVIAGVHLFATSAWRLTKTWVVAFTFTRRVLAYLFQRGMTKRAAEPATATYGPLASGVYDTLGPETPSTTIVESIADEQVADVMRRIEAPGGGVFAVVGERGAGKSTLLSRIANNCQQRALVQIGSGGYDAFESDLRTGLDPTSSPTQPIAEVLEAQRDHSPAVLVDDAHRLLRPAIGGLAQFDRVLDLARAHSTEVTWIIAVDAVLWQFLERARGAKPLFDGVIRFEPWSEEGIVRMLNMRNESAQIDPTFEDLVTDMPSDADAIDRQEIIERTEANYYRLLWDYAGGNPGVALHFWRNSLGVDPKGATAVKLFHAPSPEDLEGLPDSAVFVLRAMVQLESATYDDIVSVTALPAAQVVDALRHGTLEQWFSQDGARFSVTWDWFRAITRFLHRRHLIPASE